MARRGWLDDRSFADLVALTQLLPGPASSQLGIAIGSGRAGIAGGVAAWLGFTLPSAVGLTILGLATGSLDLAGAGWVAGLELAAAAVVLVALVAMARSLAPDPLRRAIAIGAALLVLALPSSLMQVVTIAIGAAVGVAAHRRPSEPAHDPEPAQPGAGPPARRIPTRVGIASLATLGVLLAGLPVATALTGESAGGLALADAFFRAGALVFGGGHVVLPLLHATVVAPGWVSEAAFLAGYGATQAVPGPLFSVAAYLGAVAVEAPGLPGGVGGAALALGAVFLPSFLLVYGVLPFWDRLREARRARRALAGASAAVVGLLAAALVTPIGTAAIGGPLDVMWVGLAALALGTRRIPVVLVVAGLALGGELAGRLAG
ncbi:MAG: hypothetical protein RL338_58 [Chloroflexota bacterium]